MVRRLIAGAGVATVVAIGSGFVLNPAGACPVGSSACDSPGPRVPVEPPRLPDTTGFPDVVAQINGAVRIVERIVGQDIVNIGPGGDVSVPSLGGLGPIGPIGPGPIGDEIRRLIGGGPTPAPGPVDSLVGQVEDTIDNIRVGGPIELPPLNPGNAGHTVMGTYDRAVAMLPNGGDVSVPSLGGLGPIGPIGPGPIGDILREILGG